MPQRDPHPGEQLLHPERLGQVVVRAEIERGDLFVLLPAGRDDDDGSPGRAADLANDVQSIAVGKTQVEQGEVGIPAGRLREALPERDRLHHLVVMGPQSVARRSRRIGASSSTSRISGPRPGHDGLGSGSVETGAGHRRRPRAAR